MATDRHSGKGKGEQGEKRQGPKDFLKDLAVVLVAFFFLNSFVLASFEVPTGSMENEIMTGDFLFVNKFLYGGTTPRTIPLTNIRLPWFRVPGFRRVERGDVIVFEFPGNRDEIRSPEFMFYLKRAVALTHDTVQIVNRVLYVNHLAAPLPRNMKFNSTRIKAPGVVDPTIFPKGAPYNEDNWGPEVVPWKGEEIQLTASNYERWGTFIAREGHHPNIDATGRITIDDVPATSYIVERNYLFGMGDNRDNSADGRFWGYIPAENIVGTPMIVYWAWDPNIPIVDLFAKLGSIHLNRIGTIVK